MIILLALRALLFYLGFALTIIWFSTTGILLFSFLPYSIRSSYVLCWNRFVIFWLRCTCGLKVEVIGAENLPATPYVALAKHQSSWETYFLQQFLAPVSIVLKRELLNLPFFGWGLRLTDPIAIDRGSPKQALKQTLEKGKARVADNISVLIFPEGTRNKAGAEVKYARGGANIAVASGVPAVPIAHNGGEFWPSGGFLKYPGTITVKIGKPISSVDNDSREITEQARQWIEAEVEKMDKRA
ncbi:lysophospholipid acyltransferase family protein [Oceanicoccus sagamiensis]|uniref:1-acyl-sn-glycerol-3-phosphate acyltransferase n=1 Tax=Oceanicoccus sagamiensis TaxID=716816 RepID=A0A1X9NA39_9GAMM|nr:lysophospholipid acyltransferase family protein [Oceanicoccus sagamiensis]ARN74031.1 1-acyl-sn-glycerol-3-phosphate acyltransferase [Oceanicoccus sagamiensis]